MLPPLITQTTFFPASRSRSFTAGQSGAAPAPSARLCVVAQRQADALRQLLFGQRDDVVELALENPERQIEGDARRHAFGERVGPVADDARAGCATSA